MNRRLVTFAALLAAAILVMPGTAGAAKKHRHHESVKRSEHELRLFETKLLGAQHATEHARLRALESRRTAQQRRHLKWLRSLPPTVRRAYLRREAMRQKLASAKRAAFLKKTDAGFVPSVSGQWTTAPFPLQDSKGAHVIGINAAMLPTGKVLLYSYPENPNPSYGAGNQPGQAPDEATAFVWDPAKGTGPDSFQEFKPPEDPGDPGHPADIWCSGISFNSDGTVLVTGGNYRWGTDWQGLDTVYTFDPFTETWHYEGKMNDGRWYPTQTLLPDGRTVIMSGYSKTLSGGNSKYNNDIEVYDPSKPAGQRIYKIATRTGTRQILAGQPPGGGLYPHTYVMPSGDVVVAGPFEEDSWAFQASAVPKSNQGLTAMNYPDVGTGLVGGDGRDQLWGTGVIVPSTDPANPSSKIMLLGGNFPDTTQTSQTDYATRGVETLNGNTASSRNQGWSAAPSLNAGRGHANTVILPDGSMVTVGGGYGIVNNNQWLTDGGTTDAAHGYGASQHQVELWNSTTNAWTPGPAQVEGRAYHSTAILLPDGRVLSAGDDWNGAGGPGTGIASDTAEIYSPPYLFKPGTRPSITSAPKASPYGATLSVDSPQGADITRAALVSPSATTHANDMNQRYVALSVAHRSGGVNLTAPANGNIAPPGYYMLFLIDSKGVPSVATWIRIGSDVPAPPVNTSAPTIGGSALIGSTLTATSLGTWNPAGLSLAAQWRRCDAAGNNCDGIPGATGSTYAVSGADGGKTLRLQVTASNAAGSLTVDSAPSAVVPGGACSTCGPTATSPGCTSCTAGGASDKKGPTLRFHLGARRTIKSLLKNGVTVRVRCSEPCALTSVLDLQVKARSSKKTKVRIYVLGRSKRRSASSASKVVTVTLRLSKSGKKRLRHYKPRKVRFTLTGVDSLGNSTKKAYSIKIVR